MADGGWDLRAFRRVGTDAAQQTTIGWFRDPIRHHDERYRDEHGWTRLVANAGTQGDDPYWAPAAWYRDPSRRFRYRYWDDGWTARAGTRGDEVVDPVDPGWAPPVAAGGRTSLPEAAVAPSRSWSLHPAGLALTLGVLVSVLLLVYVVFASSTGGPAA
jgi:hypothetical protein